jgi:hypothetical protein
MGEYGTFWPMRVPVVVTVLGAMSSGSAGGLVVPRGLFTSAFGTSFELRNSSGHDKFQVFANVCRIRKLRAPK